MPYIHCLSGQSPKQEMFHLKSFVTTCVFHMYGVNFGGHFDKRFDLLRQGKEEKGPVRTLQMMATSLQHTPSSPVLPSEGM